MSHVTLNWKCDKCGQTNTDVKCYCGRTLISYRKRFINLGHTEKAIDNIREVIENGDR